MSERHGSAGRPAANSDAPTGQLRPSPALTVEVAGLTDKGRVRPGNEDNLIFEDPSSSLARAQGALLVVSDGMGGHAAGEVASQIAVETIHRVYYRNRGMAPDQAIHDAITRANAAIFEAAQQNRERAGMGCTVVALVVQGADLTIGHVGDSRAYLIRGGRATQLTLDHSWVAMQVHEGILTPEQAEHHPNRSVLMRALGRQASVEIDIAHRQLQSGDIVLVCSDGLTGMVTDAEIADYAGRYAPADLPRHLVDLANSRGAPDNVTVLIGAVSGAAPGALAATQVTALDQDSTTTRIATPRDARAPALDPVSADTPTDRTLRRPQAADATLPMGAVPAAPRKDGPLPAAAGASPTNPGASSTPPAASPSTPASTADGAAASPTEAPRGRPVVVSRSSVTHPEGAASPRRGRGRWIAGALAAFGLAGALVLISIFQLTRDGAPAQTGAVSGTPVPAAAPPAARPDSAAPSPTVPPPIPSQLPGLATPAGAAPQTVGAAPPAQATPLVPVATAPAPPTAASSPAVVTMTPSTVLTIVPTVRSIFATVVPTLSGGGPRTGEAPTTSADAPSSGPAPSSTGGEGGSAGGAGNAGGQPPADTSPATDDAPAANAPGASQPPPGDESQPPEAPPEGAPASAAPGPPAEGGGDSADLCARGAALAPGLAARAGCRPANGNSSD